VYSVVLDKKVLDFRYVRQNKFTQAFYIGDILLGQVFKLGKHNWSCVSNTYQKFGKIDGFGTRHAASEMLIRLGGYREEKWSPDEHL
jgi:hypothetical protein